MESFAYSVDWIFPHPLHRRKFQKFIIEAFEQGHTQIELSEFLQVVREDAIKQSKDLDDWSREYERGIELLHGKQME